ncbi:MAG: hypothetical protein AcusKO_39100 [Acuticoccus sp.]
MHKSTTTILAAAAALALTAGASQAQDERTFYWISHGSPADPVWTYFLEGAEQWDEDNPTATVNTSFHSGDVPSHQEAVRAAIAAGADGICSTSPDPGSLVEVVSEARAAGIPIVNFNTSDDAPDWTAYVGGDLKQFGRQWGAVPRRQRPRRGRRLRVDARRGARCVLRR